MVRRSLAPFSLALPLSLVSLSLGLAGCGDEDARATSFTGGLDETGDLPTGDGDGDGSAEGNSAEGDGDPSGDGDPTTTGDGDGDPTTSGDGDGDTTTGDGDGDTTTGDGDGDAPCQSDADCLDANLPICDGNGECVPCTPDNDLCDLGQYCTDENTCVVGCVNDNDCGGDLVCDTDTNTCTGCVMDNNCPLGSVCSSGECVPGCTDQQPCQDGFSCCGGDCQDLANDPDFCGDCDNVCPDYPNAADLCTNGGCEMGECEGQWNDCDGDPNNGCETQAQCACVPGETISCYTGFPANTEGVGVCKAGLRTCNAQGTGYGACVGQVIPAIEVCGSGLDENCNGQVDENPDLDQDGWGVCDNDCCDQVSPECSTPNLVNPGAFEVGGNTVDDDCDGQVDNVLALCDNNLASNSSDPLQHARAIDLCQFTTNNPPLASKKWGVISGDFSRTDGNQNENANARAIRPGFGSNVTPQKGARISVLSTGHAADTNDTSPNYSAFQGGTNLNITSGLPADWLAANGNQIPNAPGCPDPAGGTTARDPIQLELTVRVPTNANSFSVKVYFYSSEYPEWVCSPYNDFFVALVDSSDPDNPSDKNIAIYTDAQNQNWPLGVNILRAANGLFTQCKNGAIGCGGGAVAGNYAGCVTTNGLVGTGFDVVNPPSQFANDPGYCGSNNLAGGATGWLQMSGNVTPGETMTIRFDIWDTGDPWYDSLVLLDDWQWSVQAAEPGVTPG